MNDPQITSMSRTIDDMWPQTDPRLTYEIVEKKRWYIDLRGDLVDFDALVKNGPSRIEIPKSFRICEKEPLDKSGHYSYPIAL